MTCNKCGNLTPYTLEEPEGDDPGAIIGRLLAPALGVVGLFFLISLRRK